jgi:hypothetical protein
VRHKEEERDRIETNRRYYEEHRSYWGKLRKETQAKDYTIQQADRQIASLSKKLYENPTKYSKPLIGWIYVREYLRRVEKINKEIEAEYQADLRKERKSKH